MFDLVLREIHHVVPEIRYIFFAVICLCCSCVHVKFIEWIVRRAVKTRYSWVLIQLSDVVIRTEREKKIAEQMRLKEVKNIKHLCDVRWRTSELVFQLLPRALAIYHAITYDEKLKLWNFAISQPFRFLTHTSMFFCEEDEKTWKMD